jgi:rhodanese-related sulfurtransferase
MELKSKMTESINKMEPKILNRILAAGLVAVAVVVMLMGKPSSLMPLKSTMDIGTIAQYGEDRIDPYTLGNWIISGHGDFRVVDLRQPADFSEYSIPASVNIPFTSLMTKNGIDQLPKYEKIVLVCGDGSRSGQAWTVLRSQGYEAYILSGGVKGWMRSIMTPLSAQDVDFSDIDPAVFAAKLKAMREHFTGSSAEIGVAGEAIDAPPPPPPPVNQARKKKKSGGC